MILSTKSNVALTKSKVALTVVVLPFLVTMSNEISIRVRVTFVTVLNQTGGRTPAWSSYFAMMKSARCRFDR